ncbi:MAG: hypothetical protein CMF49_03980 [Legionellales bacterium]|nr:hypothetical protein [Legionellales bacterium]
MLDLTQLQQYCLQQMGITIWYNRENNINEAHQYDKSWEIFKQSLKQCTHCNLENTIAGEGNIEADIVLVGTELLHEKSKALLGNILSVLGLNVDDVFISHIFHRQNTMQPLDITHNLSHFNAQLDRVNPKAILSFNMEIYEHIKTGNIPCYYSGSIESLLQKPLEKRKTYQQLLQLMSVLNIV